MRVSSPTCRHAPRCDHARSDDLARHAGLGNVDEAVLAERVDLDGELLSHEAHGLLAREAVAGDDGRRVNLVLDKVVRALEELGGDEDDRRRAVADFLVLLLGELNEDPARGVLDLDQVQDCRAVVRDGHVLPGK